MTRALALIAVACVAFQVKSDTPADAPEIRALIASYVAPTAAPCVINSNVLQSLATGLAFEVAFSLTEKHGACVFEFHATGVADAVRPPPELLARSFADHDSDVFHKIHSHPMSNVAYFIEGHPYASEIMFADEARIQTRQLSPDLFVRAAHAVQAGRLPGFSLSPPSLWDFAAIETLWKNEGSGPRRIESQVISSGGVWTYSIARENVERVRDALDYIRAFAMQFEMAHSEKATAAKREYASRLYDKNAQSEEWGWFIRGWSETAFELRAPYSRAALTEYFERGDRTAIDTEFTSKLEQARKFCELLRRIGVEISFESFAENATI